MQGILTQLFCNTITSMLFISQPPNEDAQLFCFEQVTIFMTNVIKRSCWPRIRPTKLLYLYCTSQTHTNRRFALNHQTNCLCSSNQVKNGLYCNSCLFL